MTEAKRLHEALGATVNPLLPGHSEVIEFLSVALFARSHVLIGGLPTAESVAVISGFARGLGLAHERVRMTPDLKWEDLVDGHGSRLTTANVLQVDDLNRSPPVARTALIAAIEDGHLTRRGDPVEFPRPFMVIATLTPVESEEMYGLPTSHREPFLYELRPDDLDRNEGFALLDRYDRVGPVEEESFDPVADPNDVLAIQETVVDTYVDDSIKEYILDVVFATRNHPDVEYGAPTRASLSLLRGVKSYAAVLGRDYVIPDDVNTIAGSTLAPRLVLTTEAEIDHVEPRTVVDESLDTVDPPGTEFEDDLTGE